MGDDFSVPGPKNDATNSNSLGSTQLCGLCVFTGSHGEEESANHKICRARLGRVSRVVGSAGKELEELSEELGCDGLLAFGRWIGVVEGF